MERSRIVATACVCGSILSGAVLIAGPLNPPAGPVASSYKTLTEVEPRIALTAANTPGDANSLFKITQPGSYYVVGNVSGAVGKHGIEVAADNVTIDLCGFALAGVAGSLDAIRSDGGPLQNGLTVRNGAIHGWMGGSALYAGGIGGVVAEGLVIKGNQYEGVWTGVRGRVEACSVYGGRNGIRVGAGSTVSGCTTESTAERGIDAGNTCVVEGCVARLAAWEGIAVGDQGVVGHCTANGNGRSGITAGIGGTVGACTARGNAERGILTGNGASIADCSVSESGMVGIRTANSCTITNCTSTANDQYGISVDHHCTVRGCSATFNVFYGIYCGVGCLIEGNSAGANDLSGIVTGSLSVVRGNVCNQNGIGSVGAGIEVGSNSRVEGNNCTNADVGIKASSAGSIIVRNTCAWNTLNWDVVANNTILVVNSTKAGAVSGNAGGSPPGSTDPSANFTYTYP